MFTTFAGLKEFHFIQLCKAWNKWVAIFITTRPCFKHFSMNYHTGKKMFNSEPNVLWRYFPLSVLYQINMFQNSKIGKLLYRYLERYFSKKKSDTYHIIFGISGVGVVWIICTFKATIFNQINKRLVSP